MFKKFKFFFLNYHITAGKIMLMGVYSAPSDNTAGKYG